MPRKSRLVARLLVMLVAVSASVSGLSSRVEARGVDYCAALGSVAYLGSSTETGQGSAGWQSPDFTYWETEFGWVSQLSRYLRNGWGIGMVNPSRGGATAADYLPGGRWAVTRHAVEEVARHAAGLAIISLGVNEFGRQYSPRRFSTDLAEFVTALRSAMPTIDLALVIKPDIGAPYGGSVQYPYRDYADGIREIAAETTDSTLIDLRTVIEAQPRDTADMWSGDGVHLSDNGHTATARAVRDRLFAGCGAPD
ncbi:acyl-CoA thioesterase-1 [Tamaricihabitans halophyticus]|uniref:Acyl-CoA thioesterase-1 n=1 Tax=Tamaricihabitans halophyticus TaxID=1262583 RepID=A0A4R2QUK9_9PSEU|nr:SGNH/GDSL hydrolase family protein [Tamaricihabitans halophyticus]TCP50765.1 acyl-CoA thioesterase-1 [Tamaricihabitans halophyticus]